MKTKRPKMDLETRRSLYAQYQALPYTNGARYAFLEQHKLCRSWTSISKKILARDSNIPAPTTKVRVEQEQQPKQEKDFNLPLFTRDTKLGDAVDYLYLMSTTLRRLF